MPLPDKDQARPAGLIPPHFDLRSFLQPDVRRRLVVAAAALATVAFVIQAVTQLAALGHTSLQYDYKPYFDAGVALNHGDDPYSTFLDACGPAWCQVGYIYPPLLAEAFRPLAQLPPHTGAFIWVVLTYCTFAAAVYVVHRGVAGWLSTTAQAGLLLAALAFEPLYSSLYFLQVGTLMLLILGLAAWAFVRGRDAAAGAALGVAAVLRVTPIIQAPMLVRSRRDILRPSGAAGLGLSVVALLVLLILLTTTTIEYLNTVLPRLGVSTAIVENQSLPGLLLRVQNLTGLTPTSAMKYAAIGLQVLLLGITWWSSLDVEGGRQRAAVFAAFLAVTPMISTITWNHHLITELLVLALIAPSLRVGARAWWLVALSYPLLWISRDNFDPLVAAVGLANPHGLAVLPYLVLTSANLVGMALLWLACLDVLGTYRAQGAHPRPQPASA